MTVALLIELMGWMASEKHFKAQPDRMRISLPVAEPIEFEMFTTVVVVLQSDP
jgi:hypothetical protein